MKTNVLILLQIFLNVVGWAQSEKQFLFVPRDLNLIDSINISDLDRSKSFNLHRTILNDSIFIDSQIFCVSLKSECSIKLLKSYNGDWFIESDQKWILFYDNTKQNLQSFQIYQNTVSVRPLDIKRVGSAILYPFHLKINEGYEADKNSIYLFNPLLGIVGIITPQTNLIRYDFSQQIFNQSKGDNLNEKYNKSNESSVYQNSQEGNSCIDTATVYLRNIRDFNERMGVAFLNSYYCEKRFYFYRNRKIKKNCQQTDLLYENKKINICKNKTYFFFKTKGGNLIAEGNWNIEYFSGYYRDYYSNGIVKSEGEKFSDYKIQKWKYYNESGKLIKEETYDNKGILISSSNF